MPIQLVPETIWVFVFSIKAAAEVGSSLFLASCSGLGLLGFLPQLCHLMA